MMLVSVVVTLAAATVALAAWAATLNARVRRTERELSEVRAELRRTEKLAALGEMGASFAHAFNDVLTPIIGRTQLLSQRITDGQSREWLATIERAALDGAKTVRRIQEFMQVRPDKPLVPVDLSALVTQALATGGPRGRAGVRIHSDIGEVPSISGDPVALREAFGHLIVNAVEATPDGGTVTVSTRTADGQAVVAVTDHGLGMTPDTQARVFEPFFSTKPGAAGLGLSLAQGIVSRHGGQLEIDSAAGRGTTIRVTFPAEGIVAKRVAPGATTPAVGPARCLVVDDDPQVRDMIRDILSNAGHKVVVAVDGSDGVEKFKGDPSFELVITDLAMPKLNGLQLARVCKTLRPAVPIVMLTGWGVLLAAHELAEHGVDKVLSKPVRMDQVLSTVAAVRPRSPAPAGAREG